MLGRLCVARRHTVIANPTPGLTHTCILVADAKNFAANANLLPDIRKKVEEVAEALGLPKKCANFCDFDNGAYETDTVSGHTDFDDEQICESDAAGGELGGCVCGSDIDPVAGCKHCSAVVKFKLNTCYDFGQI